MNERLRLARKELGLNQTGPRPAGVRKMGTNCKKSTMVPIVEFGARVGVTDGAISRLEKGSNNLTDQMVITICKEYSINKKWLRTGSGEMFVVSESALIAQMSEQYGLDIAGRKM